MLFLSLDSPNFFSDLVGLFSMCFVPPPLRFPRKTIWTTQAFGCNYDNFGRHSNCPDVFRSGRVSKKQVCVHIFVLAVLWSVLLLLAAAVPTPHLNAPTRRFRFLQTLSAFKIYANNLGFALEILRDVVPNAN